jgi:HSP20 family molecular chaperone IbpA
MIGHQPQSYTTMEAPKPADAIQLTVENSQSEQNIDSSSLEIGGEAVRENKELESGSSRFDGEGSEGRKYDENGFFYSLMVQNGWTMPKIINQDGELRFNLKDTLLIRLLHNDTKLEIFLDVFGYRPEEIMVSTAGREICVKGRLAEKLDSEQPIVARQFARQFSLPAGAPAEGVVAALSSDGVLCIHVTKHG